MQRQATAAPTGLQKLVFDNIGWFVASLALAFLVWFIAVSQRDPIEQWRLSEPISILVQPDPGLLVTNTDSFARVAYVQLQAQQSIREDLTADDVVITADLATLTPGTHVVPLTATAARGARVVSVSPSQITVTLELEASKFVPVREQIAEAPPPDTRIGSIDFDRLQVEVSGPQSQIDQVVAAQVSLNLAERREPFEEDVRLVPVNVDGRTVQDVTVEPQIVSVTVDVQRSESVRAINVRPRIVGDPPEGYFLTTLEYTPQTVYVSVPEGEADALPDYLYTEPIALGERTSDFSLTVPISLPSAAWQLVDNTGVLVEIGVGAQTVTRQFDNIPVELLGQRAGLVYQVEPAAVALIVTGAQPVLEVLSSQSLRVTIDVSNVTDANQYRLVPTASIVGSGAEVSISVLPTEIDVTVSSATATAEATAGT